VNGETHKRRAERDHEDDDGDKYDAHRGSPLT
jgi:hypothetical protein